MAEINLGKVRGDDVTKQSITSALGFPVKEIVFISQSEYDALLPHELEGERMFFIKDELGKIFYKNQLVWELPWDGTFADPLVGQILFDAELIADPTKSTLQELAGITSIGTIFEESDISSFDELKYFTGITSLEFRCFSNCKSLTSITLPESVTSIGGQCFWDCRSLTSITIPGSVTSLGDSCFYWCKSLTSITIPGSVTSIGDDCFVECESLTSITLPESLTSLPTSCFGGCTSLTSITIPESVTSLGESCFHACEALTSIIVPAGVTSLGNYCFAECPSLTSITLLEGVTSIGAVCFNGCVALTSITLPESVTNIGPVCFNGCTSLNLVTVLPATPPSLGERAFEGTPEALNIQVPSPYVDDYKTAPDWIDYESIISAI